MVKAEVDAVDIDLKTGTTLGFYTYGLSRPNVLILSAMHGQSATCVYANYLIMKHLEAEERIHGSVTLLPVASPLAYRLGAIVSPLDSMDLDAVFPGDEQGTVTQRTAWEIWRKASQADYVIQLRSGWQPCVSYTIGMHREYIHVRNLSTQIGLPWTVQSSSTRGALTTEAAHDGIPAVVIEMRGAQEVDAQAAVAVREAILNFLKIKDIISGDAIEATSTLTGRMKHVNVDHEGFFVPSTHLGERVEENHLIGHVQDRGDIKSPYSGTLISVSQMRYVFEGDIIARIATPLVDQPSREREVETSEIKRRKW